MIDLRSDTVTLPTKEMKEVMMRTRALQELPVLIGGLA